jgi:hypothetical protein
MARLKHSMGTFMKHYKATHETRHMQHGHAIKKTFITLTKHYYATYETCDYTIIATST